MGLNWTAGDLFHVVLALGSSPSCAALKVHMFGVLPHKDRRFLTFAITEIPEISPNNLQGASPTKFIAKQGFSLIVTGSLPTLDLESDAVFAF